MEMSRVKVILESLNIGAEPFWTARANERKPPVLWFSKGCFLTVNYWAILAVFARSLHLSVSAVAFAVELGKGQEP